MSVLLSARAVAVKVYGLNDEKEIKAKIRALWKGSRRKRNPIPCKLNGSRHEYYLDWFMNADNVHEHPTERIATWLLK